MKTIKFFALLCLVAMPFAITSCSSDDDGGGGGSAALGTIKAKVNGNWVTTLEMVTFANQVGPVLNIQGNTGGTSSKAFVLNVITFNGVGTYDIGGGSTGLGQANASYTEIQVNPSDPMNFQQTIWSAPYEGGEKVGEINVSEVTDTYIKGTFHFTAKNSDDESIVNVTDGSFNIEF